MNGMNIECRCTFMNRYTIIYKLICKIFIKFFNYKILEEINLFFDILLSTSRPKFFLIHWVFNVNFKNYRGERTPVPWLGYPALFRAGEWIFDFNLSVEPRSSQPWQLYLRTVYSSLGTSKGADRRFINWNHFYNAWLSNQDIIKFLRSRRKTIIFLVQHMQNLSWNCTWFVYQIPMRAVINKIPTWTIYLDVYHCTVMCCFMKISYRYRSRRISCVLYEK